MTPERKAALAAFAGGWGHDAGEYRAALGEVLDALDEAEARAKRARDLLQRARFHIARGYFCDPATCGEVNCRLAREVDTFLAAIDPSRTEKT